MQIVPWNLRVVYTYMALHVETCATTKISTVAGYHIMLATLLFLFIYICRIVELWLIAIFAASNSMLNTLHMFVHVCSN